MFALGSKPWRSPPEIARWPVSRAMRPTSRFSCEWRRPFSSSAWMQGPASAMKRLASEVCSALPTLCRSHTGWLNTISTWWLSCSSRNMLSSLRSQAATSSVGLANGFGFAGVGLHAGHPHSAFRAGHVVNAEVEDRLPVGRAPLGGHGNVPRRGHRPQHLRRFHAVVVGDGDQRR